MKSSFMAVGVVADVEHKFVRRYVRGVGKDAEFDNDSIGYYITMREWPAASIYVGKTDPKLNKGDKIRLILEVIRD